MKSLKKVVFELMKNNNCNDQEIVNAMGRGENINWNTVETYKTEYKKLNYKSGKLKKMT